MSGLHGCRPRRAPHHLRPDICLLTSPHNNAPVVVSPVLTLPLFCLPRLPYTLAPYSPPIPTRPCFPIPCPNSLRVSPLSCTVPLTFIKSIFRRLNDSKFSVTAASAIDFTGLHIVAKRVIFARECLTGFQASVSRLAHYHNDFFPPYNTNEKLITSQARRNFTYVDSLISGVFARLESGSLRMQNTINLAFNSVQQEDNRAMRLFGEVSFFVIPVLFVSSVFGAQFFEVEKGKLGVAKNFWIYWVLVGACAVGLLLFVRWRTKTPFFDERRLRWIRLRRGGRY